GGPGRAPADRTGADQHGSVVDPLTDRFDAVGLDAFEALDDHEAHPLALTELAGAFAFDGVLVHENLVPVIGGDEAEALFGAEPFDDPGTDLGHVFSLCRGTRRGSRWTAGSKEG